MISVNNANTGQIRNTNTLAMYAWKYRQEKTHIDRYTLLIRAKIRNRGKILAYSETKNLSRVKENDYERRDYEIDGRRCR